MTKEKLEKTPSYAQLWTRRTKIGEKIIELSKEYNAIGEQLQGELDKDKNPQ